jgi:hypothetical protein
MTHSIVANFDTRRDAETAVEHLVQQHGIDRAGISVRPSGAANSAGVRPAGADVESGHPGAKKKGTPKLSGPVEVSVDCPTGKSPLVTTALREAGATRVKPH